MKKLILVLLIIKLNILKCSAKECYFCIGPAEECGDVKKNENTMTCDAESHTCASYLIHIEDVTESKAMIVRVCDDLQDCAHLDTSEYGTGTCQCLREGCAGEKCNKQLYNEDDIIAKADIGIQCLLQSQKEGAAAVALFGETNETNKAEGAAGGTAGTNGGKFFFIPPGIMPTDPPSNNKPTERRGKDVSGSDKIRPQFFLLLVMFLYHFIIL